MKVACLSDTHTHHELVTVPECDMVIHAGDFTYRGDFKEVKDFIDWYGNLPAKHKILVCGNHEVIISKRPRVLDLWCMEKGITLLKNQHVVIAGYKIFGSPYSVEFGNWVYGEPEDRLKRIWDMIHDDTDILVTHGPPWGVLDVNRDGINCGSTTLSEKLYNLNKLKLYVTGHIHESRGTTQIEQIQVVNAAMCGIPYSDMLTTATVVEI